MSRWSPNSVRKTFGWDYQALEAQVATVPAGADGLLLLPYFTGERTPDLRQRAPASFMDLTLQNFTPHHMARAAMEGVTLGLGYGLARFATWADPERNPPHRGRQQQRHLAADLRGYFRRAHGLPGQR